MCQPRPRSPADATSASGFWYGRTQQHRTDAAENRRVDADAGYEQRTAVMVNASLDQRPNREANVLSMSER
jgi:hypothetical protein